MFLLRKLIIASGENMLCIYVSRGWLDKYPLWYSLIFTTQPAVRGDIVMPQHKKISENSNQ